jgi:uncharacterized protein (TIGR03067 family)
MRHTALVLVMAATLHAADGPGEAAKGDREKLHGVWLATELTEGGKKVPAEGVRIEFKGNKITLAAKGQAAVTGMYTIDPGKTPATMDITFENDGKKVTVPAIYGLKGDDLKLCHPLLPQGEGWVRPKAFEATAKTVLGTLKRQKP